VSDNVRTEEEHLAHYGILRRSGRYPWGSGAPESTRNKSFLDSVEILKKQGMSQTEIAKSMGMTTTQLRAKRSIARAQQRQEKILNAERLKEKGWSNVAIGQRMGIPESSVRALLAPGEKDKADALQVTSSMIKEQVDRKKMVDVGAGVNNQLGITRTRLDNSVAVLKEQGYVVHNIQHPQLGTGKFTKMRVLAVPGTTLQEVQRNRHQIQQINEYSEDHGRSYTVMQKPISVNSRRIAIRYGDEGGKEADGVIYVRRGAKDLTIGSNNYAQVRIAVDGTHYLKGMAVYKEDLPPGVDLMFNTNKPRTRNKKDVMKEMDLENAENPFGAIVRQVHDPKTGKVISAMNMVGSPTKEGSGEEGHWDTWSRNLSSQTLSKQRPELVEQQLDLTYDRRVREFNEINSLTNPTVRKDLLLKFGDSTDSAAVHLKAAALPRQATKVILPIASIKETEIYAPSMRDGERVALVRFPHAGTFEIPQLTVNNRNREARKILGPSAADAVGIHHKVAQHLSGADFDGDTVLVIPNNKRDIRSTPPLEGLKDFDPQKYAIPDDSPIPKISASRKQKEMGKVSNLITDMTVHGAGSDEMAQAVRHSMVVIDSEKHSLDYRQSEKDNGILQLKEKYQGGKIKGASTLLSRAGAVEFVPERIARRASEGGPIDPATGEKKFTPTGRMIPVRKTVKDPLTGKQIRINTGELAPKEVRSKKLAETTDATTLVSKERTRTELLYAEHSNRLKALGNAARKEAVHIKPAPYSPSAKKVYAQEVATLDAKINLAEKNAPLERQAQLIAHERHSLERQANPNMDPDEVTKSKRIALNDARIRTGAHKSRIKVTQAEWNAIQAGAISTNKLEKILNHGDPDTIKALALPKQGTKLSSTQVRRAQSMLKSGYTQIEVADQLGIGLTTLKVGLSE
jgi:hypothetical protein